MKHLLYIGNKLAQNGNNPTGIDVLGPLLEKEGYQVSYASSQSNKILRFFVMLFKTLTTKKTDYVLIDTYSTTNFWYAFWISRICKIRNINYIPILHGGNLPQRWVTHPRYCKLLFHQAYCNVCPSEYLRQAFQKMNCPKLVSIPNAIALDSYSFKKRKTLRPKILWVRAFAELYNPLMAIAVLADLAKNYPEAELCMVGPDKDGSLQSVKNLAAELGLTVTFFSQLPKSAWVALSEDYDFFINTTHFDNMPVSVIEAMSLGLGVVSTNVGGMPFLIHDQEDGLLVQDNDALAMSEALQLLLKNASLFGEMTEKARRKVTLFHWEVVKKSWNDILQNPYL